MKEDDFLLKLRKLIPELVYSDSLLDSESIEIPIYFMLDDNNDVIIDEESIYDELEEKLNKVKGILK